KPRKQRGKICRWIEIVDAGKRRIGGDSELRCAAAKAAAEPAQRQRLEVARQNPQRQRAPALAHPGGGCGAFDRLERRVANLREEMHMLMAVDEVARACECVRERRKLRVDLAGKRYGIEPPHERTAHQCGKRRKRAACERLERGQRPESACQRQVQADRSALPARECGQRARFGPKTRRDYHDRRRIEPATPDEIANRNARRGRDGVIVGAEPDFLHSAGGYSAAACADSASRSPLSAALTLCSATK